MATPDYKTTRPWLRQTKDESRKTKGRAKPELWNYGTTDLRNCGQGGSRLVAHGS